MDINSLRMVRGTTFQFGVKLFNAQDQPYELENDDLVVFGVKKYIEHQNYDIFKTLTLNEYDANIDGYIFTIDPEDTIDLQCGNYYYDVGVQTANDDYYVVIEKSNFKLAENVTSLVQREQQEPRE